jgi:hypothetical protein
MKLILLSQGSQNKLVNFNNVSYVETYQETRSRIWFNSVLYQQLTDTSGSTIVASTIVDQSIDEIRNLIDNNS